MRPYPEQDQKLPYLPLRSRWDKFSSAFPSDEVNTDGRRYNANGFKYYKYIVYTVNALYIVNMSERREKFVRLAENRVNRTIKEINLIGNLSNKSAYEYYATDIEAIFEELEKELKAAKAKFKPSKKKTDRFSLR